MWTLSTDRKKDRMELPGSADSRQGGQEVPTHGLHRGKEEMSLSDAALVHWEGWVIARGAVARLNYGGAFAITALFRNVRELVMSREELSQFLTSFHALASSPPIDLPHGSPVTEVHAPPIPTLRVLARDDWRGKVRRLVAGFHYGPIRITGAERATSVYDAGTRTVHYRDFAAEATARARLASHGAKPEWNHELGEARQIHVAAGHDGDDLFVAAAGERR